MKSEKTIPKTIDEYISGFPEVTQAKLEELRNTIKNAAPEAIETISYQMPAFKLEGILVYFAAFKNHIGFYPTSNVIEKFSKELSVYKGGKGSVRFPLNNPLPRDLITKIIRFRVNENLQRAKQKRKE